jgi:hypothetical protein
VSAYTVHDPHNVDTIHELYLQKLRLIVNTKVET